MGSQVMTRGQGGQRKAQQHQQPEHPVVHQVVTGHRGQRHEEEQRADCLLLGGGRPRKGAAQAHGQHRQEQRDTDHAIFRRHLQEEVVRVGDVGQPGEARGLGGVACGSRPKQRALPEHRFRQVKGCGAGGDGAVNRGVAFEDRANRIDPAHGGHGDDRIEKRGAGQGYEQHETSQPTEQAVPGPRGAGQDNHRYREQPGQQRATRSGRGGNEERGRRQQQPEPAQRRAEGPEPRRGQDRHEQGTPAHIERIGAQHRQALGVSQRADLRQAGHGDQQADRERRAEQVGQTVGTHRDTDRGDQGDAQQQDELQGRGVGTLRVRRPAGAGDDEHDQRAPDQQHPERLGAVRQLPGQQIAHDQQGGHSIGGGQHGGQVNGQHGIDRALVEGNQPIERQHDSGEPQQAEQEQRREEQTSQPHPKHRGYNDQRPDGACRNYPAPNDDKNVSIHMMRSVAAWRML